jgi:hypothetical protein
MFSYRLAHGLGGKETELETTSLVASRGRDIRGRKGDMIV